LAAPVLWPPLPPIWAASPGVANPLSGPGRSPQPQPANFGPLEQ
jgi:hypothetical protein